VHKQTIRVADLRRHHAVGPKNGRVVAPRARHDVVAVLVCIGRGPYGLRRHGGPHHHFGACRAQRRPTFGIAAVEADLHSQSTEIAVEHGKLRPRRHTPFEQWVIVRRHGKHLAVGDCRFAVTAHEDASVAETRLLFLGKEHWNHYTATEAAKWK
jgi:hypothetical protein